MSESTSLHHNGWSRGPLPCSRGYSWFAETTLWYTDIRKCTHHQPFHAFIKDSWRSVFCCGGAPGSSCRWAEETNWGLNYGNTKTKIATDARRPTSYDSTLDKDELLRYYFIHPPVATCLGIYISVMCVCCGWGECGWDPPSEHKKSMTWHWLNSCHCSYLILCHQGCLLKYKLLHLRWLKMFPFFSFFNLAWIIDQV